ncbi:peptidase S8/S53 domain-containing protein [Mycena rosella]|uniref:Peptidase S8/S53 domain-containing protein n=1 Tax=Mycena rosella TaxID=1033263 RepID=A0AAD7D5A9_MYCRO|nr:peptidase S8/S53 domain-containing protein [Mycena rosella]
MVLHESISNVPSGFKASGSPSPNQEIKLFIALVQSNITGLAKVVDAYLTAAEVSFTQQAEGLFNTKFSTYTHSANGQEMIRALNYSLPSTVQQHILHVHPIIAFTSPPQRASQNTVYKRKATLDRRQLAPCEDIVRPVCIQEFYGIPNTTISGSLTNSIGVQGYNSASLGEYANNDDLATFLNEFRPDIAGNTFSVTLLNGAQNLQDNSGGLEGQIDIQYTVGVAGNRSCDFLHVQDTINWLLSQEDPPTVFTTSYANEEAELTQSVSTSVCNGYMQLAAIGTPPSTFFRPYSHQPRVRYLDDIASGDGGASDSQQGCTSFVPMFPSTCPYVTSVGGTFFQPPTAFSSSAGGFSNYFPVPSYQAADTAAYLESIGDEYSGMYNPNGRGFPDVAAEWEVTSIGGTSCASPIFASFIALVNDRLIAAGKPVLGFLNPLLYSTGKGGLDDVTVGSGWNAATGWDPISGLGTPDFPGMMEALGI